ACIFSVYILKFKLKFCFSSLCLNLKFNSKIILYLSFHFTGLNLLECDYPQFGSWEKSQKKFTEIFESKTQEEWCKIFDYKDACVTPVLSMKEAPFHFHNDARKSFTSLDGQNYFPQPAPILSRTPGVVAEKEPLYGEHTIDILTKIGYNDDDIKQFLKNGVAMSNNITSKY
ncbi:alpha-methylacyl-CoA racemase-like, partial [Centruroides sculpturatus]|uniref:alpha-methylacyl-CoA racemase-like n=1 Tax=Centruroides sculpturatus TaxID=218467 RepID=UPI000C6CFE85